MAVTYRTIQTSTTATVTKPASLANGDLMLAFVPSDILLTTPSGWTYITSRSNTDATGPSRITAYYKHVTTASSEPASYTFTSGLAVVLIVVYGHVVASPIDFSDNATGTTLNVSGTVSYDGSYAVIGGCCDGTPATTGLTGWTFNGPYDSTTSVIRKAINAGATGTISWSVGTGTEIGILAVVKPKINVSTAIPVATATCSMPSPGIKGNVDAPLAVSTSELVNPTVSGGASTAAQLAIGSAVAADPTIIVGSTVLVQPPQAMATALALEPTPIFNASVTAEVLAASAFMPVAAVAGDALIAPSAFIANSAMAVPATAAGALQVAPVLPATGGAAAPAVVGGAIVYADTQNAFCLSVAPVVTGGAVMTMTTMTVVAETFSPVVMQSVTVPVAVASAQGVAPLVSAAAVAGAVAMGASAEAFAPGLGMAQFVPAMTASAAGLAPSLTWGARLASSSATMTAEALVAEAGMVRHPVAFRGGAAHVMVKARHANNERQETAKAEHRQLVSHETFAVRRGSVTGSATVTAPVAASVNREV